MDPLERAVALRQEADELLAAIGLPRVLSPCARVVPTGSYFLDVMVYPDIDLMISAVSIEQLFRFGAQFAAAGPVFQVVFEKAQKPPDPPGGLYLKLRAAGAWERPWKIDIWSLPDPILDAQSAEMQGFRDRLTPALRERIIHYKLSVMTAAHRTPMYSGYHIYKAFLDEGLTEFSQVTQYLIEHDIRLG